jgi:predicted ATPase/DNA-binding winged helix-turn-helix (wHTH) protein
MSEFTRSASFDRAPAPSYRFGNFALFVAERRLEQLGREVKLGARAFDLLSLLVAKAGEVVTKQEISDTVWPGVVVGETSLRFQIVALRKLLGQDPADGRVIATISGRGYCFVMPVDAQDEARNLPILPPGGPLPRIPARLSHMVGRDAEVATLVEMVESHRFATVIGPGGIGKTTVAVAAVHQLAAQFADDIVFVDLGSVGEAESVAPALTTALGLPVDDRDPLAGLARFLHHRRILIILDSCEHVITAAAAMSERLFQAVPGLHIIATSREALRVEGEHVLVLPPLPCPDPGQNLTVDALLDYPAACLLLDRAAAGGSPLSVGQPEVNVIAEICSRLDGIPLAIELAAGRIPSYGLSGTAALLNDRFRHLQGGRRTAIPRHRTLADTLAWSFELLDERARTVLRRLAVFVGEFEHDAATVVSDDQIDESDALEIIESLVAKSLVATRQVGDIIRFRLLDTTRAYLLDRLHAAAEVDLVRRRHAEMFRDRCLETDATDEQSDDAAKQVPNLRVALAWCFGPGGDPALGVNLAAAAAPLFLRLSLLAECREISRKAIEALDSDTRNTPVELELQACLGQSLMFTTGNTEAAEQAFERALHLAEHFALQQRQLQILGALHIFHERTADFGKALEFAERGFAIAEQIGDPASIDAAHSLLGIAWHLLGRHDQADHHLRPAMARRDDIDGIEPTGFGFNHRNRARITFARSLWLRGRADEAIELARQTVEESANVGHPVTHCIALIWAISVAEWSGDLDGMEIYIDRFAAFAERHSLQPYQAVGICMRGQLAIRRGDHESGTRAITDTLSALRAAKYEMLTTGFLTTLAEGLLAAGDLDRACKIAAECAALMETHGDRLHAPEVLRVQASIHTALGNTRGARTILERALTAARAQSAAAWELRCACDLIDLDGANPSMLMQPILSRFGPATRDETWQRAQRMLAVAATSDGPSSEV